MATHSPEVARRPARSAPVAVHPAAVRLVEGLQVARRGAAPPVGSRHAAALPAVARQAAVRRLPGLVALQLGGRAR